MMNLNMRPIFGFFLTFVTLCLASSSYALSLQDLSNKDAVGGLKEALTQGAGKAVESLGRTDGFLGNAKVKIPLPPSVQKAQGMMRSLGMGKYADELETTMNRAAEAAVPEAKTLLVNSVKTMSVEDAKGILQGGNDAGTQYRSAIYFHDAAQEATAREVLAEVNAHHGGRAVTELLAEANYSRAEDYHQHYFANHPDQGYCGLVVAPKVEKFRKTFAARVQPG